MQLLRVCAVDPSVDAVGAVVLGDVSVCALLLNDVVAVNVLACCIMYSCRRLKEVVVDLCCCCWSCINAKFVKC